MSNPMDNSLRCRKKLFKTRSNIMPWSRKYWAQLRQQDLSILGEKSTKNFKLWQQLGKTIRNEKSWMNMVFGLRTNMTICRYSQKNLTDSRRGELLSHQAISLSRDITTLDNDWLSRENNEINKTGSQPYQPIKWVCMRFFIKMLENNW